MPGRGKGKGYQGRRWIRDTTRLAIYLRDGRVCAYCAAVLPAAGTGGRLTLDHVIPHAAGGGNGPENLVTACQTCNSRASGSQNRDAYGPPAAVVAARTAVDLRPYRAAARKLIAHHGGLTAVLAAMVETVRAGIVRPSRDGGPVVEARTECACGNRRAAVCGLRLACTTCGLARPASLDDLNAAA